MQAVKEHPVLVVIAILIVVSIASILIFNNNSKEINSHSILTDEENSDLATGNTVQEADIQATSDSYTAEVNIDTTANAGEEIENVNLGEGGRISINI